MSMVYKNVSNKRANDWISGMEQTMILTKKLFKQINDEIYIIGNAITTYPDNAPLYGSEVLPYVDGVAHCHYAEYEGVVGEQRGNGTLNTTLLLKVIPNDEYMYSNGNQSIVNQGSVDFDIECSYIQTPTGSPTPAPTFGVISFIDNITMCNQTVEGYIMENNYLYYRTNIFTFGVCIVWIIGIIE